MATRTTTEPPPTVFTVGRIVLWIVLALMALSILYTGWHVIEYWTAIGV